MRLETSMRIEQKQNLIITPRLQQALHILQLSSLELEHLLQQEAEENPLLEVKPEQEREVSIEEEKPQEEWEAFFRNTEYEAGHEAAARPEPREQVLVQRVSLAEHLNRQMNLVLSTEQERRIAAFLVGCLDEKGFLSLPVQKVAWLFDREVKVVEKIRRLLMKQDPPGNGAYNIREALLVQLKETQAPKKTRNWTEMIINEYWAELESDNLQAVYNNFPPGQKAFEQGLKLLRCLNPYPAEGFEVNPLPYLEPDIILVKVEGKFEIIMNDYTFPRLILSNRYRQILSGAEGNREARKFLEQKLKAARWLLRCIEQRRHTLFRITEVLLDLQQEFFFYGPKALKPLTLREVAASLGIHLSTVCRATTGKFLQTPFGIYELKYFFNSGIDSGNGALASVSIKEIIKEMIRKENSRHPLSDQQIADMLKEREGMEISRRTVAKYRQQMRVPPSTKRKGFYKNIG